MSAANGPYPSPAAGPSRSVQSPDDRRPSRTALKGKRTRTGCLTCRARKVKCDETPDTCKNCTRVRLECKWFDPNIDSVGPIRRRNRKGTCHGCRVARCKCSSDRPTCTRCAQHGMTCEYTSTKAAPTVGIDVTPSSAENNSPHQSLAMEEVERDPPRRRTVSKSPKPTSIEALPRALLDKHIEAYFSYVYPSQANAIIHRGTLQSGILSGTVSPKLLLAICAVASRFIHTGPGYIPLQGSSQATMWAKEAKTILILEEDMSLDTVACALILAKHDINSGKFSSAWVLTSIANRCALALGLHCELPPDHPATGIERETRRRLMWGCYCLDRMMATGVPEYITTHASIFKIKLPCEEHHYLFGQPVDSPIPTLEKFIPNDPVNAKMESVGLFGQYVRSLEARTMVLACTRTRERDRLVPWDPDSPFQLCIRKMHAWKEALPPSFRLSSETIYARQSQNQLTALAMLHIWYDQTTTDLYRVAFPGFPESANPDLLAMAPPGWVENIQHACVAHAKSITATLAIISKHVDPDTFVFLDASLPICVYESMRMQVLNLFMVPPERQLDELEEVKASFELMMGFVERMRRYFRQAEWLLKEMRRLLRRHGIVINGGSQSSASETSGSQTPNHPWIRRVRGLRNIDDTPALPLSDEPRGGAPEQQYPPNVENQPAMLDLGLEGLGSEQAQEDMTTFLNQYEWGRETSSIGSFLSMLGEWTAPGFDANAFTLGNGDLV